MKNEGKTRIISSAVAAVLALSMLAGCGNNANNSTDSKETTAASAAAESAKPAETTQAAEVVPTAEKEEVTEALLPLCDIFGKQPDEAKEIFEKATGIKLVCSEDIENGIICYSSETESAIKLFNYDFAGVEFGWNNPDSGVKYIAFRYNDSFGHTSRHYTSLECSVEQASTEIKFAESSLGNSNNHKQDYTDLMHLDTWDLDKEKNITVSSVSTTPTDDYVEDFQICLTAEGIEPGETRSYKNPVPAVMTIGISDDARNITAGSGYVCQIGDYFYFSNITDNGGTLGYFLNGEYTEVFSDYSGWEPSNLCYVKKDDLLYFMGKDHQVFCTKPGTTEYKEVDKANAIKVTAGVTDISEFTPDKLYVTPDSYIAVYTAFGRQIAIVPKEGGQRVDLDCICYDALALSSSGNMIYQMDAKDGEFWTMVPYSDPKKADAPKMLPTTSVLSNPVISNGMVYMIRKEGKIDFGEYSKYGIYTEPEASFATGTESIVYDVTDLVKDHRMCYLTAYGNNIFFQTGKKPDTLIHVVTDGKGGIVSHEELGNDTALYNIITYGDGTFLLFYYRKEKDEAGKYHFYKQMISFDADGKIVSRSGD